MKCWDESYALTVEVIRTARQMLVLVTDVQQSIPLSLVWREIGPWPQTLSLYRNWGSDSQSAPLLSAASLSWSAWNYSSPTSPSVHTPSFRNNLTIAVNNPNPSNTKLSVLSVLTIYSSSKSHYTRSILLSISAQFSVFNFTKSLSRQVDTSLN